MPIGHMQVSAAYAAAADLDDHFTGSRRRIGNVFDAQGLTNGFE